VNTKLIAASHIYRYTMNVDVKHLKFLTKVNHFWNSLITFFTALGKAKMTTLSPASIWENYYL